LKSSPRSIKLKFVEPNGCLDRTKLNVCVDQDGTIREFVFTD